MTDRYGLTLSAWLCQKSRVLYRRLLFILMHQYCSSLFPFLHFTYYLNDMCFFFIIDIFWKLYFGVPIILLNDGFYKSNNHGHKESKSDKKEQRHGVPLSKLTHMSELVITCCPCIYRKYEKGEINFKIRLPLALNYRWCLKIVTHSNAYQIGFCSNKENRNTTKT